MTTLLDILRLDIGVGPVSPITNHSAQDGTTTGWSAGPSGVTLSARSGQAYGFQGRALRASWTTGAKFMQFFAQGIGVAPGQWVSGSYFARAVTSSADIKVGFLVGFYNSANQLIGSGSAGSINVRANPAQDRYFGGHTPVQAPAGTAFARVQITMDHTASSGNADLDLWYVTMVAGATPEDVMAPQWIGAANVNVIGPSVALKINRGNTRDDGVTDDIGPGTLDATIRDANLNPRDNVYLRPNRRIRARVLVNGTWVDLATVRVDKAEVIRDPKRTGAAVTDVIVHGFDAVNRLANADVVQAYSGNVPQRLAKLLERTGVRGQGIDPNGVAVATPVPITPGESKKALEWLTILRDTVHGYAKVDADDVVRVVAPPFPQDSTGLTFTDKPGETGAAFLSYVDIDYVYATDQLTNSLTIERVNLDQEDGTKDYGPYLAADSVAQWGLSGDTVTVTDGDLAGHAAYFLSDATQPADLVKSLTFKVDPDNPTTLTAATVELYKTVVVKHLDHVATYRVIGISHDINAEANSDGGTWRVTYRLRPLERATSVELSTPAGGANTGPSDVAAGTVNLTHASRYRSGAQAIPDTTPTSVSFNALEVEHADLPYDATNRWFTATRAGVYQITALVAFAGSTLGHRNARIQVNAATRRTATIAPAGMSGTSVALSAVIRVAAGDKVSVVAQQTSGGALDLVSGASATAVDITRLGY